MKKAKTETTLHTETKSFHGVEFTIVNEVNGEVVKTASKTITLISALKLYNFLKSHLDAASHTAEILSYYANYGDNIEKMLDEDEKNFKKGDDKKTKYEMGGNYAFFLGTKKEGGAVVWADNHEAAKIIKKKYKEAYPDNKIIFDAEMSHCYVYAETREEAKRFMIWMNKTYFEPWVKDNLDGWDEFMKAYNEASEEERSEFAFFYMH